jgi:hypothetical protein
VIRGTIFGLVAFTAIAHAEDRARPVIEKHCGACHRPDSLQANPKALAIFDLSKLDWSATMTPAQLRNCVERVRNLLPAPSDDKRATERAFDLFGGPATPAEVAAVKTFVDAQVRRRAAKD